MLITTFGVLSLLAIAAVTYVDSSTQAIREARHNTQEVQSTHLCEAGVQAVLRELWHTFKIDQHFEDFDVDLATASTTSPKVNLTGQIPGVGRYAAGIVGYTVPSGDNYNRHVKVRSVGWLDYDNDGVLDNGEPRKTVDVVSKFSLLRSQVFDYTYFANNYGWMYGFNESQLIVNGDMRANGNVDFQGGSPTINGTIVGAQNNKLSPAAAGLINSAPVKWTDSKYQTEIAKTNANQQRWRQAYDPSKHGAVGSEEFEKWRDLVYESDAQVVNYKLFGSSLRDSVGARGWARTSSGQTPSYTQISTDPTSEVIMPDLSNLSYYQTLSSNYVDTKATYSDGTANPYYGQGAFVEVWNSSQNKYVRVSTNGLINGSTVLVGTSSRPIKIHGPVTVSQDVVIKGYVQGQGTLYSGRNTHIVGSIYYKNGPDFRGSDPDAVEASVEKADFLGLAARASVIMGNPTQFGSNPLQYMSPPFTTGRYDENGNYIPPFNAYEYDSTGRRKYQSTISDSTMNSIAEGVNQIDAIMYTNFVGGGQLGTGGGGVTINGSIISKDEAMVIYSLPLRLNYDNRIRERKASKNPLIDLQLPRSPKVLRATWQDKGFSKN